MRCIRQFPAVTKHSALTFFRERMWRMAAAVTYYALLTLGPLMAIQLELASYLMDEDRYRDEIFEVMEQAVGEEGAEALDELIENFSLPESGWLSYVLGFWMLFFGGTNAVAQLRESMQKIWHVEDEPGKRRFILMFWVYFSAQIILFGACFTHELDVMPGPNNAGTPG